MVYGRYARVVDHLAVKNVAQGAPLWGGSTLHPMHFWNDCLGTHLHRIGFRPDPYCMLRSLREPTDRKHLGQCTALLNRTECGRYWEARTQMVENWIFSFFITIFCDYSLLLGRLYLPWMFFLFSIYSATASVVRVSGFRYRGLGFDSRHYQIFWVVVGLERGPLRLVRSIEELLE